MVCSDPWSIAFELRLKIADATHLRRLPRFIMRLLCSGQYHLAQSHHSDPGHTHLMDSDCWLTAR